jgi:hypothetical protein
VTAGETLRQRSPLRFYVLVFALSVPFWLAGAVADRLPVPLPAIGEEDLVPLLRLHHAPAGVLTAVAAGVALGGMGRRRGAAR